VWAMKAMRLTAVPGRKATHQQCRGHQPKVSPGPHQDAGVDDARGAGSGWPVHQAGFGRLPTQHERGRFDAKPTAGAQRLAGAAAREGQSVRPANSRNSNRDASSAPARRTPPFSRVRWGGVHRVAELLHLVL
jgi:hypothetical protein